MKKYIFVLFIVVLIVLAVPAQTSAKFSLAWLFVPEISEKEIVLSDVTYSLNNRHKDTFVNEIFSDNILLTVAYMSGKVKNADQIAWEKIKAPGEGTLTLKPGETFAFHDNTLDKYQDKIASTTNAHFNATDGFRSSGYLVGDGVCHLASFMKVAAEKAQLQVEAPVRHDFASIPEVNKIDGVSIFSTPYDKANSSRQNLYITNNQNKTVAFVFTNNNSSLNIKVEELN